MNARQVVAGALAVLAACAAPPAEPAPREATSRAESEAVLREVTSLAAFEAAFAASAPRLLAVLSPT